MASHARRYSRAVGPLVSISILCISHDFREGLAVVGPKAQQPRSLSHLGVTRVVVRTELKMIERPVAVVVVPQHVTDRKIPHVRHVNHATRRKSEVAPILSSSPGVAGPKIAPVPPATPVRPPDHESLQSTPNAPASCTAKRSWCSPKATEHSRGSQIYRMPWRRPPWKSTSTPWTQSNTHRPHHRRQTQQKHRLASRDPDQPSDNLSPDLQHTPGQDRGRTLSTPQQGVSEERSMHS